MDGFIQGFTLIVVLLSAPADDPCRERRIRGLTEKACAARAASQNRRGQHAYCTRSFLLIKPGPCHDCLPRLECRRG
jgi:hypothetical protein